MEGNQYTQNIIQRLTVQSFAVKGFSFAFIGLVGNVLKDFASISMLIMCVLLILILSVIDSYYLSLEKVYRQLEKQYQPQRGLDYKEYGLKQKIIKAFLSISIWPIYLALFGFILILYFNTIGVLS